MPAADLPALETRLEACLIELERLYEARPRMSDALARAPDRGDAVVMCFTRGQDTASWQATDPNLERPRVIRGHENKRPR
jgi:hypothetical protein